MQLIVLRSFDAVEQNTEWESGQTCSRCHKYDRQVRVLDQSRTGHQEVLNFEKRTYFRVVGDLKKRPPTPIKGKHVYRVVYFAKVLLLPMNAAIEL